MWEQEPRSPSPQGRTQTRATHAARVAMSMKKAKNGNMPDGLKACVLSMLMMATMYRLIPEITGKLPRVLFPSPGLAGADIPNGFAVHHVLSMLATMGFINLEITGPGFLFPSVGLKVYMLSMLMMATCATSPRRSRASCRAFSSRPQVLRSRTS